VLLVAVASGSTARAQRGALTDLSAGVTAAFGARDFFGVEAGAGRSSGQTGIEGTIAAGADGDAAAVRVGTMARFIFMPTARRGASPYGGLGVAFLGARGRAGAGYLCATLGVEAAPGRRRGWYVEGALGGGVLLTAGMRWRPAR